MAERRTVAAVVVGSSPIRHPVCKHAIVRAPVAQWTEHLTSDQVVGSSNLSGGTQLVVMYTTYRIDQSYE